jgi:hypothetical protein
LGTPHSHSVQIVSNATWTFSTAPTNWDFDLSAQIPVGTKMVSVWGYANAGAAGAQIYPSSTTGTFGFCNGPVIGQLFPITGLIQLTPGSRTIRFSQYVASLTTVNIWISAYWW